MYSDRIPLYEKLERARESRVLTYVTSDRRGLETKIASDVLHYFIDHLDEIGDTEKISLFIYTRGGNTLAAWSIANLIRQFCDTFEVIIPFVCHSAGTLISLGADEIVMTKQATLGPIDPSVNLPLNPAVPGAPPTTRVPVSVEAVSGFLELARSELQGIEHLHEVLLSLASQVHPLVLGASYRARSQIRMLGGKLIARQVDDEEDRQKILDFLCSDSGSHDYTINRDEAREDLGLSVTKPDDDLYGVIKAIYDDIAEELELTVPYDPKIVLGGANAADYSFTRALLESTTGGCHSFVSEGRLQASTIQKQGVTQRAIADQRRSEGWQHAD